MVANFSFDQVEKGEYLLGQLQSFPKIYSSVAAAVRTRGMLAELELRAAADVEVILTQLREYGITVSRAKDNPRVIRLEPPLTISYPELDYFIAALENSIKYAEKMG